MKKNNCSSWILIIISVFLITSSIILNNSLILKSQNINKIQTTNKISVKIKSYAQLNDNSVFTYDDIEKLQDILQSDITYTANTETVIKDSIKSINADIVGTNYRFIDFYTINFRDGYFFTEADEEENEYRAVIDEKLAWELFGNLQVAGNTIKILGREFTIAGVISKDNTIIGKISSSDDKNIYIPFKILNGLDKEAKISSIQIKMPEAQIIENNAITIKKALSTIEKLPENYDIIDYSIKNTLIEQKLLITTFILGLICIIIIIKHLIKTAKQTYNFIKIQTKKDYLTNILKNSYKTILKVMVKIIALIMCIYILFKIIKFNIYIPTDRIPKELIDINFFGELIKKSILNSTSNTSYALKIWEIQQNIIERFVNILFYILILAIPLMYLGLNQLRMKKVSYDKVVTKISIAFILSIIISTLFIILTNMPLQLNTLSLFILYLFFMLNTIAVLEKCEEKIIVV